MSEIRYLGANTIINRTDVRTDRYGMSSGSVTWEIPNRNVNLQAINPSSTHPDLSFLELDSWRISVGGPFIQITADYFGISGKQTEPVWEVNSSSSTQPIATHPDFSDKSTKLGAFVEANRSILFDEYDDFTGFSKNPSSYAGGDTKDMNGVDSYYALGVTIKKTYCARSLPGNLSKIPRIEQSPKGFKPSISNPYNCLYLGIATRQRGKTYEISENWIVSGKRGWNKLIYTT